MFKDKLKQLRIDNGLKQSDVAKAIGVSAATIGNYEQGTRLPRNKEIYKSLADFFNVSISYLMDKDSPETRTLLKKSSFSKTIYRTDIPIIYEGVDITRLVLPQPDNSTIPLTPKEMYASTEFLSRSGHVIFARRNLLKIIQEIRERTALDIQNDFTNIVQKIQDTVIFWYKKCWDNIDDLFPKATDLSSLYDLLDKCLRVDMLATDQFYLEDMARDFDWLREKLNTNMNNFNK